MKVTMIYGAGASIPFFPGLTTSTITKRVLDYQNWKNVINKSHELQQSITNIEENQIRYVLGESQRLGKNFEQIAEIFDKIASWAYDSNPQNTELAHLLRNLINATKTNPLQLSTNWIYIPFIYRQVIAEFILEFENNPKIQEYQNLIINQNKLFSSFKDKHSISIASLNYDECLLKSIDPNHIKTCFEQKVVRQPDELKGLSLLKAPNVIYFPHGQLRFRAYDANNVFYYNSANTANNERYKYLNLGMKNSNLIIRNGKFAYDFNTWMVTGQTKDTVFNNHPFSEYYLRLANDIFNSDVIITAGYSFGDDHINRFMTQFLADNSKKVLVIDYNNNNIDLKTAITDNSSIVNKINMILQPMWYWNPTTSMPYHQQDIDDINKKGFGRLFDNVFYYKKGYGDFLGEWRNIFNNLPLGL